MKYLLRWMYGPVRDVIALVATDSGVINMQLSCGHVYWVRPTTEGGIEQVTKAVEKYGPGLFSAQCANCQDSVVPKLPVGVQLPLPEPEGPGKPWIYRTGGIRLK